MWSLVDVIYLQAIWPLHSVKLRAYDCVVTLVKILGIQIDFSRPNELVCLQDSPWQLFDVTWCMCAQGIGLWSPDDL